jgi:hypothetical protein
MDSSRVGHATNRRASALRRLDTLWGHTSPLREAVVAKNDCMHFGRAWSLGRSNSPPRVVQSSIDRIG